MLLCAHIFAQVNRDSMLQLLSHSREDTSKARLLFKIADSYEGNHQDSSLYYIEKARRLSLKLNFVPGIYQYHTQHMIVDFTRGKYASAKDHSEEALLLARQLKDSNLVINTLGNTSIIYQYLGL